MNNIDNQITIKNVRKKALIIAGIFGLSLTLMYIFSLRSEIAQLYSGYLAGVASE